jgi:hypothetical protein
MYALSCGWSGLAHPVRAANNHALAIFQSRLTDSGEIPMTSPVPQYSSAEVTKLYYTSLASIDLRQ